MRENIVRIKTHDTEKTYEFSAKKGEANPQLWEVEMKMALINSYGNADFKHYTTKRAIYIERETVIAHGLTGKMRDKEDEEITPPKTPEDLIMELLEFVGVYPTEE